eukprot:3763507-Rhodomonas_salina.3
MPDNPFPSYLAASKPIEPSFSPNFTCIGFLDPGVLVGDLCIQVTWRSRSGTVILVLPNLMRKYFSGAAAFDHLRGVAGSLLCRAKTLLQRCRLAEGAGLSSVV